MITMRKLLLYSIVFYLFNAGLSYSQTGSITVKIKGIKNNKGNICVLLFKNKEGFPDKPEKAFKSKIVAADKADNKELTIILDNVSPNDYAISVLHDENKNNQMDYNWLGMPKEGFGLLTTKKSFLSLPKFEDSKFSFSGSDKSITIEINY